MKALLSVVAAAWFAASAAAQGVVPSTPPAVAPAVSTTAPVAAPVTPPSWTALTFYICPMHPQIVRGEPGKCPICQMDLTPMAEAQPGAVAESAAARQAQQALLPAIVSVRIQVLEDKTKDEDRSQLDQVFDDFVRERSPMLVSGIRVSAEGLVLIRDPNMPLRRYGDIVATDSAGAAVPVKVASVLENYAAVLLEPKAPVKNAPFLALEKADLKTGDKFLLAEPAFIEDALIFGVSEVFASSVAVEGQEKHLQLIWWQEPTYSEMITNNSPTTAPVVFDAAARAIGIALDNSLWVSADGSDSWVGARIMADGRLTREMLEANAGKIKAAAKTGVKEIEIMFRDANRLPPALHLDQGKLMAYGLLLDKSGTIFIPTELDRNLVRFIERITVLDSGKRLDARFQGMFRDFGGIIVRASNVTGEPAVLVDKTPLARGKLFYSLRVQQRFGARSEEVEYNRYLDVMKGYKESRYPLPRKPLRAGDLLTDADGRFLGFCAPFRKEKEDEINAGQGHNGPSASRQPRIYLFTEVAAVLRDPQTHYERGAGPSSRKEEGRLVWLGVEFQTINQPLARALNAETATLDGARGLLVTDVYDDSPATKNGIQPGDILLSIGIIGGEGNLDLAVPPGWPEGRNWTDGHVPEGRGRFWRHTFNYLSDVLTRIGAGREVRIRLLHDKQVKDLTLTLEKEPDNFDIADSFGDRDIGLGVHELTYEVRKVLHLPPNAPGVVVAEVQGASKAGVAQIAPYEIITKINGRPVRNLRDFAPMLLAAKAAGKLEFIVTNFGVERIVELNLSAAPAPTPTPTPTP